MPKLHLLFFAWMTVLSVQAQTNVQAEFRGVWLATLNNIDWPSTGGSHPERQKEDYIALLDFYQSLNFNAVIVQIRPAGDAFYPSKYAPWSRFLTGKEGDPGKWREDPLQFMIEEAHARNMEFHAWLNPYRATCNPQTDLLHRSHIYFDRPEWIVRYGSRYYLDPGIPEVRKYIGEVVGEVVSNYDIDAIHFDDYFYPYPVEGEEFGDRRTFARYGVANFGEREAWRRANVDSLISTVSTRIKQIKPNVRFGVSPFGVWRNIEDDSRGSRTNAAYTTYDHLYADPLVWVERGWVDYLVPQIYWSTYYEKAPYPVLAKWWSAQADGVDIYAGQSLYKVGDDRDRVWNDLQEVPRQIAWNRSLTGIKGNVFYSARSLLELPRLQEKLRKEYYQSPVLSRIEYRKKSEIKAPEITGLRASRNTLFVDLRLKDLEESIRSVLVLDNAVLAEDKIVLQQDLREMPSLQVALMGEKMEIVLAYLSDNNEIGTQSRVIRLNKSNGEWKVNLL